MQPNDARTPRVYMDARLTPHRSLSRGGLRVLLAVLVAYNLLIMGFLLLIGAFPVPIFLGLDFVGVVIAFRVSNRRAGWAERVQVTADAVRVARCRPPAVEQTIWSSPTAFTRVQLERGEEHEAQVRLTLSGRGLAIGASLSPAERSDFAAALARAISEARGERYSP